MSLLDLSILDRAVSGIDGEAKKYDPDQPRAANGEWGDGGGGAHSAERGDAGHGDHDDGDEDEVGQGYDPADQAEHDQALDALTGHVARLQKALDAGSEVFHDPNATAAQVASAAEAIGKHYDAAGAAIDTVNALRDAYGDEHEDVPVLGDHIDLRDAVDSYRDALGTLRSETGTRAQQMSRMRAAEARLLDPVEALRRGLEAAIGGKGQPGSSGLSTTLAGHNGGRR